MADPLFRAVDCGCETDGILPNDNLFNPGEGTCNGGNGINGKDGLSAYQIWLQNGNVGTEQDFLNSLKGDAAEGLITPVDITGPDEDGVLTITSQSGDPIRWNIGDDYYEIASPQQVTVQPASENMFRKDRILLGPGTITLIEGTEDESVPLAPNVPDGYLALGEPVDIYGDIISPPVPPDPEPAPAWVVYGSVPFGKYTNGMTVPANISFAAQTREAYTNVAHPTYVQPQVFFSGTPGPGTYEVGASLNILLDGAFIQNNAGAATGLSIKRNGTEISTTEPYTDNGQTGAVGYTITYDYAQGAVLNNEVGVPDPFGRVEAGSKTSSTLNYNRIYPIWYMKSGSPITASAFRAAILVGTATKLLADSTGTITIPFNATGEYLAVAYPSTSTTKTVWYVNALDNGAIPGGVFGAVDVGNVTSPTGLWSGVSYKAHVSPGLITQSSPIQLRNS